MEILFVTNRDAALAKGEGIVLSGMAVRNPKYFDGSIEDAKKVIVIGDYPEIVKAYKAAKVEVKVVKKPKSTSSEDSKQEDSK